MKKLGKLKLNYLAQSDLNEKEMNVLVGGGTPGDCCCSCWAADSGGSGTSSNDSANNAKGQSSIYGCDGDKDKGDGGGNSGGGSPDWTWQALGDQYCTC